VRYTRPERKPGAPGREEIVAPEDIPPDYYWRYFRAVVDTALEQHGHLFSAPERERIDALLALPRPCQQLYVRMFTRKGDLFRSSKLDYPEIGDLQPVLEALEGAGFVRTDPPQRLGDAETLARLTVPELKRLAALLELATAGRKSELLERLAETDAERRAGWLSELDHFHELLHQEPFLLCQVLFFGNRHQDQTAFVLVDLEVSAFEDYPVSRSAPLFPDRSDLDEYLVAAARWDSGFERAEEADLDGLLELAEASLGSLDDRAELPPHRRRVDPSRYDERLAQLAGRELERAGEHGRAVALYERLLQAGRSATRAARVADRMGLALKRSGEDPTRLVEPLEPWLASPSLDDISRHQVELRLFRLGLGDDPRARLLRPEVLEFELEAAGYQGPKALYRVDEEALSVEEAVHRRLGCPGMWCENVLYSTLFGLLFWDVIFAPLEGMFQHPFQDAPLDYRTEFFHPHRTDRFGARIAELTGGDPVGLVLEAHQAHAPRRCTGVAWDALEPEVLADAARAMGPGLVPVLERIGRNPRRHRRGLPDLFVWCDGRALLVEVKGPGDQVFLEQALWHDFLLRHGVDVRLARVKRA